MVLNNLDAEILKRAKQDLEGLKATKLSFSACGNTSHSAKRTAVEMHLISEIKELMWALEYGTLAEIETECADVSNMVDILFMILKLPCDVRRNDEHEADSNFTVDADNVIHYKQRKE